jgi:mannose-6-phosphate isomerase-like protein (cupin superfamily)
VKNIAPENPSRRNFLRAAPVAAAAGITLTDTSLFASSAVGQGTGPAVPNTFQLFTAQSIQEDIKALQAAPGNNNLVDGKSLPVIVMLTVETAKNAKEFEWHENRDHIFQIIDGSTVYEVGGTPKGAHSTGPGEWLAPASEGATTITLKKGDMLVIPRGTPHKRNTAESVTLTLISPMGTLKA